MSNNSDVLVLIPNFNHAKYLVDSIESALKQTYACDILVVDDGSTDNSEEVIKSFGNKIQSIFKENRGPGHTRNTGVRWALSHNYKYIQLLDADDGMYPDKVELLRAVLEENYNKSDLYPVGISYDDYMHLYNLRNDIQILAVEFKRSATPELLWQNNLIHCNCMVHSDVFKNTQLAPNVYFDETMRVAQDYDFWLRATQKYIAWHYPEALSFVREGENNTAAPIQGKIRESCMITLRNRNAGAYA